jgi:hypothetical protein
MMQAELHGHASREILTNEDYLTSTVFGHLRYLPPNIFWERFFSRAVGIQSETHTLLDYLKNASAEPSRADSLRVCFWPSHSELGTPDLCLCFSGEGLRPVVVVIEAKLDAGKSGTGENDQLLRYLLLIRRLTELDLPLTAHDRQRAAKALLFLTPHNSSAELRETAELCHDRALETLLFRAQWQDITAAASACSLNTSGSSRTILEDIAHFLRRRNLEYFSGFARLALPTGLVWGGFYMPKAAFTILPIPQLEANFGYFYGARRPIRLIGG